jgi:hypothetical protein
VSLAELLVSTIRALETAGIDYMLTGSLASTFHGEPRATRDIDVVIDASATGLETLLDRLHADGMYVDDLAARTALRDRGQFNAVGSDAKVDFIIRKDTPFSRAEFDRRQRVQLPWVQASVVTAEDLILAKLAWARETDSERQLRDIAGMVSAAGDDLDRAYVDAWAARLGVGELWRKLSGGPAG